MTQRTEKVNRLARQVIGEAISSLKDPRIGFATVTAVRVTPDLRHARVMVSVLVASAGLASASPTVAASPRTSKRTFFILPPCLACVFES